MRSPYSSTMTSFTTLFKDNLVLETSPAQGDALPKAESVGQGEVRKEGTHFIRVVGM